MIYSDAVFFSQFCFSSPLDASCRRCWRFTPPPPSSSGSSAALGFLAVSPSRRRIPHPPTPTASSYVAAVLSTLPDRHGIPSTASPAPLRSLAASPGRTLSRPTRRRPRPQLPVRIPLLQAPAEDGYLEVIQWFAIAFRLLHLHSIAICSPGSHPCIFGFS